MTNFSGKPLSPKTGNADCGGPQGGGMDSRRNGVAEVSSTYPADLASKSIPVGYKQTEVGLIPDDWFIEPLEKFTSFISYGFTNPMPTTHVGPYMITARDISDGKIQYKNARTTDIDAFNKLLTSKSRPKKNDLLLTKDGTLGRLALAEDEQICINQSVAILRPNQRIVPLFFKLLLESPYYQERMIEEAGGSTIKHIYITIINRMPLSVPSDTKEQTAIANALSDVDALISELEKLFAKKQAIKTATMQQLLTGRTRLPQFALRDDGAPKGTKPSELGEIPEDWEVLTLGRLATIKSGGTPSTHNKDFWDGEISWCTPTDITALDGRKYLEKTTRRITEAGVAKSAADLLPLGTVVMTSRATIGECAVTTSEMTTNQGFKNFICGPELDNEFLFYLLGSLKDRFIALCSGSTFLEISTTQVRNFSVVVPEKTEQTAIATILSDMDEELQALEQRLSKTRQIKQGMMQELLTGRTRLVPASAEGTHAH